jgi:hypothetical protein
MLTTKVVFPKDPPSTEKVDLPVIVDLPVEDTQRAEELRLLDTYAGLAMQAACMDSRWFSIDQMTEWSFKVARAMLRARDKST